MLAAIVFAGAIRCASTAYCPTDAQLIEAFRNRRDAWSLNAGKRADARDPANIHLMEARRIVGIEEVHCGEPDSSNNRVTCRFVVRYAGGHSTRDKARLIRKDLGWAIETDTAFSPHPSH